MLHIILVLWIPGNLIHSPLKGQGAARCPQVAGGLTPTPGPLGKGPHPSSSGLLIRPSATATGPRRPAVPPSPPYSQKFPQTPPFPQKSYAVWLAITSDWHSWLFTICRESFPTGGHKLLEGRDQVLASLVFSRGPSRACCAQHALTNAWWTMNKEVTCEVFLTPLPSLYKQKKDPKGQSVVSFFPFWHHHKACWISSPAGDWTHAPALEHSLNLWTTRKLPGHSLNRDTVPCSTWIFPFPNSRLPFCIFKGFLLIFLHVLSPDIFISPSSVLFFTVAQEGNRWASLDNS